MSIITISSAPGGGAMYFAMLIARAEAVAGAKVAWIGSDAALVAMEEVSNLALSEMDGTESFDLVVVDSGDLASARAVARVARHVLLVGENIDQ